MITRFVPPLASNLLQSCGSYIAAWPCGEVTRNGCLNIDAFLHYNILEDLPVDTCRPTPELRGASGRKRGKTGQSVTPRPLECRVRLLAIDLAFDLIAIRRNTQYLGSALCILLLDFYKMSSHQATSFLNFSNSHGQQEFYQ